MASYADVKDWDENEQMNKRERVFAALKGEKVDRPPVSAWGHFFDRENSPEDLAKAMIDFNRKYDWDFVKIQARYQYHSEVWGCTYKLSPDGVIPPYCTHCVIKSPEDWHKLKVKDPTQGALGEHLHALRLIKQKIGDTPVIHTVFSPLSIAKRLMGGMGLRIEKLMKLVNQDPDAFHVGLDVITETFSNFVELCMETGIDGIFYAPIGVNKRTFTEAQYDEFGRPYDLRVLESAKGAPFNMIHLCGSDIMFDYFEDYPVQCINWSIDDLGNPSLDEGLKRTNKALVGGVSAKPIFEGLTCEQVTKQVCRALNATSGKHHLLTPGCSIRTKLDPDAKLMALRRSVETWKNGKRGQLYT